MYPIKSCAGCSVQRWPLGPNGLLLDREWALVGPQGNALTQKGVPALAAIRPHLDLAAGVTLLTWDVWSCKLHHDAGPKSLLLDWEWALVGLEGIALTHRKTCQPWLPSGRTWTLLPGLTCRLVQVPRSCVMLLP